VLTVLYDNYPHDRRLRTAWGFSCLVEHDDFVLLFDTGGDAATLLCNMSALGHDPSEVDVVVLSHIHDDHVGGLGGVLAAKSDIDVYVPRSFPASFKDSVRQRARVVEVGGAVQIDAGGHPGIYTTGEMGRTIREQSLVIDTPRGLVVITGCAHPGIVDIVAKAKDMTAREIYLVMGGFHLRGAGREEIARIVEAFRELGVEKVAPSHCSGDLARELFEAAYGCDYIAAGVGHIVEVTD